MFRVTIDRLRSRVAQLAIVLGRPAKPLPGSLALDSYNPDGQGNRYALHMLLQHGEDKLSSTYNAAEMNAYISGAMWALDFMLQQQPQPCTCGQCEGPQCDS